MKATMTDDCLTEPSRIEGWEDPLVPIDFNHGLTECSVCQWYGATCQLDAALSKKRKECPNISSEHCFLCDQLLTLEVPLESRALLHVAKKQKTVPDPDGEVITARATTTKVHPSKVYKEPTKFDRLVGRGGGLHTHEGNKRFHDIYKQSLLGDYESAEVGEKIRIAERLVALVENNGGWFLEKDEHGWFRIEANEAVSKAGQALREAVLVRNSFTNPRQKRVTAASKTAKFSKVYKVPTKCDRLMGRSGGLRAHEGNKRFYHVYTKSLLDAYETTVKAGGKQLVAEQLVALVEDGGGWFLQKDDLGWFRIDAKQAVSRASQALREAVLARKNNRLKKKKEDEDGEDDKQLDETMNAFILCQREEPLDEEYQWNQLMKETGFT